MIDEFYVNILKKLQSEHLKAKSATYNSLINSYSENSPICKIFERGRQQIIKKIREIENSIYIVIAENEGKYNENVVMFNYFNFSTNVIYQASSNTSDILSVPFSFFYSCIPNNYTEHDVDRTVECFIVRGKKDDLWINEILPLDILKSKHIAPLSIMFQKEYESQPYIENEILTKLAADKQMLEDLILNTNIFKFSESYFLMICKIFPKEYLHLLLGHVEYIVIDNSIDCLVMLSRACYFKNTTHIVISGTEASAVHVLLVFLIRNLVMFQELKNICWLSPDSSKTSQDVIKLISNNYMIETLFDDRLSEYGILSAQLIEKFLSTRINYIFESLVIIGTDICNMCIKNSIPHYYCSCNRVEDGRSIVLYTSEKRYMYVLTDDANEFFDY